MSSIFSTDAGWIVKRMGASAQGNETYSGTLQEKLEALSTDTLIKIDTDHRYSTSGDGKMDIVAFYPFNDGRGVLPIVFGQCACTNSKTEIEKKVREVSFNTLNGYLRLQVPHIPLLLSPVDMYDCLQRDRLLINSSQTAIMDRTRIISKITHQTFNPLMEPILDKINEFKAVAHNYILT